MGVPSQCLIGIQVSSSTSGLDHIVHDFLLFRRLTMSPPDTTTSPGEVMFTMVDSFLSVLCPDWKIRLLGVTSDGARNMTGRVAGVVTRIDNAMNEACQLTRIWCGAHQLDLVMEYIMSHVIKQRFFSALTGLLHI
jgi:hypothetical protein